MTTLSIKCHKTNVPFTARLVAKGEKYGRHMCLIHDKDDPLVEFYDARYMRERAPDGTMLGKLISRYYLSTLTSEWFTQHGQGMCLHAGVDDWHIDAQCKNSVIDWATRASGEHYDDDRRAA